MKRKRSTWSVDWFGSGTGPEVGQIIVRITPRGSKSFARIVSLRPVANRRQLPEGASCRYRVTVERIAAADPADIAWVLRTYPRKRKPAPSDPYTDPMSPLL